MPWYSKEQPTPFDTFQIPGLESLHGDVVARQFQVSWVEGKKCPLLVFPSGLTRELRPSATSEFGAVHIFDGVEINYRSRRDEAYEQARPIAEEFNYQLSALGTNRLRIFNSYSTRNYELTFNEQAGYLVDLVRHPDYTMELLDGEGRALLPPLYHNEALGLEAIAPLKFFTPTANWTWYPTEFDGNDLFFGLVSGFEVELGYFSLSELESVGKGLILPIERDRFFEPTSLKDLMTLHQRRG